MRAWMAGLAVAALAAGCAPAPAAAPSPSAAAAAPGAAHLFVWAGDKDKADSDFLAVVDVKPGSATYGQVVATLPVGAKGTAPHHTEYEFPEGGKLFADGWLAGMTSLIDLSDPRAPKLEAQFEEIGPLSHPHSYARLPNGNVMVTLQGHDGKYGAPGGVAELGPDGRVIRTASARSAETPDDLVWPYSLVVVPEKGVAVVSLAEMGWPPFEEFDRTDQVQVWSIADLKLKATVKLPPSGVGEHQFDPAEPRVLADGTVYVSTFSCGLYRIDGVETDTPAAVFVHAFPGGDGHDMCAVPVVYGRWWVQTVPKINGLVVLDVSDPKKPVEVSQLTFEETFHMPHWVAADRTSGRLVVTGNNRSWVQVVKIDEATGALSVDATVNGGAGVTFDRASWPHGETGPAVVHGALFGK